MCYLVHSQSQINRATKEGGFIPPSSPAHTYCNACSSDAITVSLAPMKCLWLIALLAWCLPVTAIAATSPGKEGFVALKHCVMENDAALCHNILTPESYDLFDRFFSYKLMPCLPTDFVYESERSVNQQTVVRATMPAGNNMQYILHMVFTRTDRGIQFDIPGSLQRGLGKNWENKIQLAEQIYLLLRQNLGGKLTCDKLADIIK